MPTFPTPEPITVSLELGVADIRLMAGDRADTVVDVQPSDPAKPSDVVAAEQAHVDFADGVLHVKAAKGWRRYSFRGGGESIEVRIELPTGSHLRGEAGVAGLRAGGTLGDVRYRTGAGDIALEHVGGSVDLTTGTGAVRIDRIDGPATIRNSNGDTWVGEVGGDCQVKAANGTIAVDEAHAAVTAKTANGDVQLGGVARGVVVAETACGKVDVAVRAGVAAWLDLHTGFGHVHNLLDTGEPPAPSEDTVEVRARSSFSDITVRRAEIGDSGDVAASRPPRSALH
ncbi:MAG: hypothetical protein QOD63_1191 [Actinomycetota bacterium]|jgi:hypothetical protein|nr:hypothetical protein [Actinomycetota bacterium]